MKIASHPNIIRFFGVTNLQGKVNYHITLCISFTYFLLLDNANYSLVLEYVEDGTLAKHLRDNARSLIEWKRQLKFAKEIAGAVSWLHHNKIIHGDLVNIIVFHSSKGNVSLYHVINAFFF